MATIKLLSYNPYQPVGSEEPDEALVVVAVVVGVGGGDGRGGGGAWGGAAARGGWMKSSVRSHACNRMQACMIRSENVPASHFSIQNLGDRHP